MAGNITKDQLLGTFDRVTNGLLDESGERVRPIEAKSVEKALRRQGKRTEAEVTAEAVALASTFEAKPTRAAFQEARALLGKQLESITVRGKVDLQRLAEVQAELRPFVRGLAEIAALTAVEAVRTTIEYQDFAMGLEHGRVLLGNAIPPGLTRLTPEAADAVIDRLQGTERQAVKALADYVFGKKDSVTLADLHRGAWHYAADIVLKDDDQVGFSGRDLKRLDGDQRAVGRLGLMLAAGILPKAQAMAIALPGPDEVSRLGFGALGKKVIFERLAALEDALKVLRPGVMPHHPDVKATRKAVLWLRHNVDIFAHAFPKIGDQDPYLAIRKDLDRGYELIGAFKDELDAQRLVIATQDPATGKWSEGVRPDDVKYANPGRLGDKRTEMLAWKADFVAKLPGYKQYLGQPTAEPSTARKEKDLSDLFWGGIDKSPKAELTGIQNVSRLVEAMIDDVRGKLKTLEKAEGIIGGRSERLFHEARKQLRAALDVAVELPQIILEQDRSAVLGRDLLGTVASMGAIEDLLAARGLAKAKERPKIDKEISSDWKAMKKQLKKGDVDDNLRDYARNLIE